MHGIKLDTGQIQTCEEFVNNYNSNEMAAPIDTEFLFRENEINRINDAFKKKDVVILKGAAGNGKTRLALEYAQTCGITTDRKIFCIRGNGVEIYEDLELYLNTPGNYLFFIDDANKLRQLQCIIQYTTEKNKEYNIKILITVRNHDFQMVKSTINDVTSSEDIEINILTDHEIKKIIETKWNIFNYDCLERIVTIAEGNARLAVLAGKMVYDSRSIDSIRDASELYDEYYRVYLNNKDLQESRNLLITAGIVAFLNVIDRDDVEPLLPILESNKLCEADFINSVSTLHCREIIDVHNDSTLIHISEPCFSNFLLKYIFYDKKLLSLSEMVQTYFQSRKKEVISSVTTMVHIFKKRELYDFIKNEIKMVWDDIQRENSPYFFEYLKSFYAVNTTETLLILRRKIEQSECTVIESNDIRTKNQSTIKGVDVEIINILGNLATNEEYSSAALDLYFQYYIKRPGLFRKFSEAAEYLFNVRRDSNVYEYFASISFLKKLKDKSDNWKEESITKLLYDVSKKLLRIDFRSVEHGKGDTGTIFAFPLIISESVKEYRGLIWQYLSELSSDVSQKNNIREVLNAYDCPIYDVSTPVLEFDIPFIKSIIELTYSQQILPLCPLLDKLARFFNKKEVDGKSLFHIFFANDDYCRYRLLIGPDYSHNTDVSETEMAKRQEIEQYITNDTSEIFHLIDICHELNSIDMANGNIIWEIKVGLGIAFDVMSSKKLDYVEAIRYYIRKNTPSKLDPCILVKALFMFLDNMEVFNLINEYDYDQKNSWIYAYYHELPAKYINQIQLQHFYTFLSISSGRDVNMFLSYDIDFLEKYIHIDSKIYIKIGKIIIEKKSDISSMAVYSFFRGSPENIIQKFIMDIDLLEDIYFLMLERDDSIDYNGQFLEELYLHQPSILKKYIRHLIIKVKDHHYEGKPKDRFFFKLNNYIDIFTEIFQGLIQGVQYPTCELSDIFDISLSPVKNNPELSFKQDALILHCIRLFNNDAIKMHCLFVPITGMDNDRKTKYIKFFIDCNKNIENFKELPLAPNHSNFHSSIALQYREWIRYLKELFPYLTGVDFLEHKKHIENLIECFEKHAKSAERREILQG